MVISGRYKNWVTTQPETHKLQQVCYHQAESAITFEDIIFMQQRKHSIIISIMKHFIVQVEAVDLISDGKAPRIVQTEEGATYDKIWKKKEVAKVYIS
jgi:hypothetical protein